MAFPSLRSHLTALLLGAALLAPAMAQTVLRLPAADAAAPAADLRHALTLAPGEALRLEGLPLGEPGSALVSAELRRTNAGTTAPLLVVHSGSDVTQTRPAPRAHFTGQLVGDPQSSVFVSIDSQGALRSIVRRGEDVFVSDMGAPSAAGSQEGPALRSRRVDTAADAPSQPFVCGVDANFLEKNHVQPSAALLQNLQNSATRARLQSAAALGPQRRADIIIETDYELYQRLGSSSAVHAYVTDLFGYISAQYQSEAGARLNLTQVNVHSTSADPWSGAADSMLEQLVAYWNASSLINQPRHHVHLLSGRESSGGIAYLNTLSSTSKTSAYGVSTGIVGDFSASNPKIVWDALVVAHEIGHAFGSDHTHNYDAPSIGSTEGGAIDCCAADYAGSQCAARAKGLPGIGSTTGGTSGSGAGTIMSYCHTLSPGMSNITFNFGTNHTRGVNPWRVASVLQGSAQTHLPLDSVVQNYALSVSRQGTGSGSVASTPAGIDCGSTCSASYAAGTSVTLSVQAASGSTFAGWGGACSGTASSCSVSMDSARSVTASFTAAPVQRLVTLSKSGTGTGSVTSSPSGLSCSADCGVASASFASTSAITLTAQAASGSTFAGWSGACTGSNNCTIAAGASSASVTASFNTSSTGTGPLPDPVDFVTQQYQDFMRRAPDSAGLTYWVGQLNAGASTRAQLVESFMNSAQYKGRLAPIVRLYTAYFRRLPDYPGLMYWFNSMYPSSGTGNSLGQVSQAFAQS
ncbi:MAG: M12 family metallo-peptidase, partial [Simplicispira sp.]|nr:M12 family metallo-peptidase [Simplicispira sp.]